MKYRIRIIKMFGINIFGTWVQYNEPIICYRLVDNNGKLSQSYHYSIDLLFKSININAKHLNYT